MLFREGILLEEEDQVDDALIETIRHGEYSHKDEFTKIVAEEDE